MLNSIVLFAEFVVFVYNIYSTSLLFFCGTFCPLNTFVPQINVHFHKEFLNEMFPINMKHEN